MFDTNKRLLGMNGSFVDDVLRGRNNVFKNPRKMTQENSETTPDEDPSFSYAGLEVRKLLDNFYIWINLSISKR